MNKKFSIFCALLLSVAVLATVTGKKYDSVVESAQLQTYAEGVKEESTDTATTTKNSVGEKVDQITGIVGGVLDGVGGEGGILDQVTGNSGDSSGILGGIGDSSGEGGGILGGIGGSSGEGGGILGGIGDSSGEGGGILGGIGGIGDSLGEGDGLLGGLGGILGGLGGAENGSSATNPPQTTMGSVLVTLSPVAGATQIETPAQSSQGASDTGVSGVTGNAVESQTNPYRKPTGEFKAGDTDEGIKWIQWIFVNTGYGLDENGITGVLDEATVKVIKKLQKEKGLEETGDVNAALIDQIELLYFEHNYGVQASQPAANGAPTTMATSTPTPDSGENDKNTAGIIVLIIAIVWVIALTVVLVLVILKKKKNKKLKAEDSDKSGDTEKENNGIQGMSDLFDEANK